MNQEKSGYIFTGKYIHKIIDTIYDRLEGIQIFDWYIWKEVRVKRRVSPKPEADDKLKRSTFSFPVQTVVCEEDFSFLFNRNWIIISGKHS